MSLADIHKSDQGDDGRAGQADAFGAAGLDPERSRLMRLASGASVMVASLLLLGKVIAWWLTGSMAMMASLADTALDLVASGVTLLAVSTALTPADSDHRFGHGKAEALAGLFQAAIMLGSALFLLLESISRLSGGAGQQGGAEAVSGGSLIMLTSAAAIILTLLLVAFQSYVIRRSQSLAIAGDRMHYMGDLLMNAAVLGSGFLMLQGIDGFDPIFGALIALYIAYSALGVGRPAIDMLMDREFDEPERELVFELVMSHPEVRGMHDLRTRRAGGDSFIQMHIELDGTTTVADAQVIIRDLEAQIGEQIDKCEIIIHADPVRPLSHQLTQSNLNHATDPVKAGAASKE